MQGAIICGVDGSQSAGGAARVARSLSGELGLDLVFVHAVERKAAVDDAAAVEQRLERLRAGVYASDGGAAWFVEVGHPVDALLAAATKAQAAMIVVGSTGPRSSLLGSVSADVSRRAPCPVVVVPPGAAGVGAGGTELAGGVARFGLGGATERREPNAPRPARRPPQAAVVAQTGPPSPR